MGLEPSVLGERSATHFSHSGARPSVIDLMFLPLSRGVGLDHTVEKNWMGPSDHAPLTVKLPIVPENIGLSRRVLPKDSANEEAFLEEAIAYLEPFGVAPLGGRLGYGSFIFTISVCSVAP